MIRNNIFSKKQIKGFIAGGFICAIIGGLSLQFNNGHNDLSYILGIVASFVASYVFKLITK